MNPPDILEILRPVSAGHAHVSTSESWSAARFTFRVTEMIWDRATPTVSRQESGHLKGRLAGSHYELTEPLGFEVGTDGGNWNAYLEDLGLPGYGDTKKEAIEDLQSAVVEYYEILMAHKDSDLGPVPRLHKAILKDYIKAKGVKRIASGKKRS